MKHNYDTNSKHNRYITKIYKNFSDILMDSIEYHDTDIFELMYEYNIMIAGGACTSVFTNRPINDYDLYFPCSESGKNDYENFRKEFREIADEGVHLVSKTTHAETYLVYRGSDRMTIQLINMYNDMSAIDILNKFDLTVCMCGYVPKEDKFYHVDSFMFDINNRVLKFNANTEFPLSTLIRVNKYISKGYTIDNIELIKIGLMINQLNISTVGELKEQLHGIYPSNEINYYLDSLTNTDDSANFDLNLLYNIFNRMN